LRGARLLAINDSRAYLAELSEKLASNGFQVTTVTSGPAGLELLERESFQIAPDRWRFDAADDFPPSMFLPAPANGVRRLAKNPTQTLPISVSIWKIPFKPTSFYLPIIQLKSGEHSEVKPRSESRTRLAGVRVHSSPPVVAGIGRCGAFADLSPGAPSRCSG
jgi:hypothetical protein